MKTIVALLLITVVSLSAQINNINGKDIPIIGNDTNVVEFKFQQYKNSISQFSTNSDGTVTTNIVLNRKDWSWSYITNLWEFTLSGWRYEFSVNQDSQPTFKSFKKAFDSATPIQQSNALFQATLLLQQ